MKNTSSIVLNNIITFSSLQRLRFTTMFSQVGVFYENIDTILEKSGHNMLAGSFNMCLVPVLLNYKGQSSLLFTFTLGC